VSPLGQVKKSDDNYKDFATAILRAWKQFQLQSPAGDDRPNTSLIAIWQDGSLWNGYVWLRIETSEDLS
jgi:hypothetical protein